MLRSHFLTLVIFSTLVSTFFASLTRETPREAIRVGSIMLLSMIGISVVVAYVMYVFPLD
jgi:hypothetical protein